MTSYFISVSEEGSTWRIGPAAFSAALKLRWPEVANISNKPDRVVFEMQPGPGRGYVYGNLRPPGDTVVVEMVDDLRDIVTIAI